MRPRERAIREQLRMIADVCRGYGVACLMNGDVETREQAEQLIKEFGVDGAMIATAAEANSSCFRSKADGGLAPWREVVENYVKTALEVENRWGNTKYLLGHLVPGRDFVHRGIQSCKSYKAVCDLLGFEHLSDLAKEVDEKLNLVPEAAPVKHGKKKANESALAAGGKMSQVRSSENNNRKPLSARGSQGMQPVIALSI